MEQTGTPDPASTEAALATIYNYLRLSESIATSGQPEPHHWDAVRAAGFEAVLNLLPPGQEKLDEEERVEALGMDYAVVPVVWMNPKPNDWERFAQVLKEWEGRQVFVHCQANMRVSAFFYILRCRTGSQSEAEARAEMNRIWTPNPVWQAFIETMLAP